MIKIIVVYKSKTGFTQRYGELIAQKLGCEAVPYDDAEERLAGCDTVVFGTRAHAGRIDGWKKARTRFSGKKLVLFVTGATPNQAQETVDALWQQNLTPEERRDLPHFYMQSGLCYEKMPFSDRIMMKIAGAFVTRKRPTAPEEAAFQHAFTHSHDIFSQEYATPLIDFLRAEK